MGIYHSTIRAETKTIDGIEIGRYGYAYKESWSFSNYPGGRGRLVRLAESRAQDAQWKNRKVRHFVMADSFAEAAQPGYFVFRLRDDRDTPPLSCSEIPGEVVGTIRKVGGRFTFIPSA